MKLHLINIETAAEQQELLLNHSRARAEIFAGWPDVNYCGGCEADVFDQIFFKPTWASVVHEGRTIAVGRMIPADGPFTMVEEVWPHGIETPLPDKSRSVELHRIGKCEDLPPQIATLAVLKIQFGFMQAMQACGRPHMFFLTPKRVAETTLIGATRHGPAIQVDGAPFFVVSATLEEDALTFMAETIAEMEQSVIGAKSTVLTDEVGI